MARLLLACALAKIHRPAVDIRKPYTQIGDLDAFSGRTYDEKYITQFVTRHFLHLFHRRWAEYIEAYQALVLIQPDSSVSPPVKEAWFVLRQAAETNSDAM